MAVMLNCCVAAICFSFSVSIWTTEASSNLVESAQCRKTCEHHFECCTINHSVLGKACRLLCFDKFQTTKQDGKVMIFPIKKGTLDDLLCDKGNNQQSPNNRSLTDETEKKIRVTPRILIFSPPKPGGYPQTTVYQMFLQNLTVRRYPHINIEHPVAAAYIASNKALIIAKSEAYSSYSKLGKLDCRLQYFRIDSSECFHTENVCVGSNMAVDESQGLVFLPCMFPVRGIMVITIEGRDLKSVVNTTFGPECIAVDESRSRIFLSFQGAKYRQSKVVQYHYNGTIINNIYIGKQGLQSWMSFDLNTKSLYFQLDTKIQIRSGNASVKLFEDIKYSAISLHIIEGDIYFIPSRKQGYFKVIRTNGTIESVYIRSPNSQIKSSCLVK